MPSPRDLRNISDALSEIMSSRARGGSSERRLVDVDGATFKSDRQRNQRVSVPDGVAVERPAGELPAGRGANHLSSESNGSSSAERLVSAAITGEYRYAMLGISLGVLSILGGILLGLHGVGGHTSWTAKFLGLQSQINDAAPGVVLFIVGLFMLLITKPRVRLRDLKDE